MSLEREIVKAVEQDGLAELIVRVGEYARLSEAIGEPASWQAIAKYTGRVSGPWGVGVRASAIDAIHAALEAGRRQASSIVTDGEDIFG